MSQLHGILDSFAIAAGVVLVLCGILVQDAGNTGVALAFGIPGVALLVLAAADRLRRRRGGGDGART